MYWVNIWVHLASARDLSLFVVLVPEVIVCLDSCLNCIEDKLRCLSDLTCDDAIVNKSL